MPLGHVVPIVAGAVIFDLLVGDWLARPDAGFGAQALAAAAADFAIGTVGGDRCARRALKGGIGTASLTLADGAARGSPSGADRRQSGRRCPRPDDGSAVGAGTADLEYYGLRPPSATDLDALAQARAASTTPLNTTIGVVATDADLDQACTKRIAMAAHDGLARAIVPAHSPLDGDTIFAVATGAVPGAARDAVREFTPVGMHRDVAIVAEVSAAAATVTQRAIVNAVLAATRSPTSRRCARCCRRRWCTGQTAERESDLLRIDRRLVEAMVAHARTDHPDEACGVLPGPEGSDEPTRIVEMMNAERSPTFYRFDSGEQLKVWRAMDDADEVPVVIYHSHTATDPYPSRTDSGLAAEPDAHYVLVGTADPDVAPGVQLSHRRRGDHR